MVAGAALQELKDQYDVGADPATVLTDLAEFVHFVTRVRYVDTALNDPSLSEDEKTRGKASSDQLSPRILGRTWQRLLKGIAEVQSSPRPLAAADMVLVRLTHAADLPTPDEIIKKLQSGELTSSSVEATPANVGASGSSQPAMSAQSTSSESSGSGGGGGGGDSVTMKQVANGPTLVVNHEPQLAEPSENPQRTVPKLVPVPEAPSPEPIYDEVSTFEDLLQIAEKKRDIRFKLMLRNNFSEISFHPGRIEFHPVGNAPRDMAQILDARLREWTGKQWEIVVAEAQGNATVKEIETETRERNFAQAESNPVVAAVLKTFPKSKILDVRFPGLESEDGLDEASVQDAALDNPDDAEDSGEDVTQGDGADANNINNQHDNGQSGERGDPGAGGLDDYFS